ncbi:flagellin [Peribacillus asahii]|uniref:flagellin N-terminal helical domain-containing protein n=1 Tax=Peribacillus asahii TaxID=228899 RepID=UPI00257CEA6F|nr:flagellin [Peribacillus asahii]
MIINHNISALNTLNRLNKNNKNTANAMGKLSSGLRINRASDDSAGLAISEKMRAQIRGLEQAQRNIQDGVSLIQTAESGLATIQDPNLLRLRELAIQSVNDTLTDKDRQQIQEEVEQVKNGINEIANTTHFNGINLLNKEKSNPLTIAPTSTLEPIDNVAWQESSIGFSHHSADVIYVNDKYISVGRDSSDDVAIAISSDGVSWTNNSPSISGELESVTYGNGKYVAVGWNGLAVTSMDGVNWTQQTTGTTENLTGVAYGNGKFVAVGTDEVILSSTDGVNWVQENIGALDYFHSIKYENNIFVAGTNNYMWYSTDGVNWTEGDNLGLGSGRGSLTWDGSRFVASLMNGDIAMSDDGMSWTVKSTDIGEITALVLSYGENIALIESNTPSLWISTDDGNTWIKKQTFSTQYQSNFTFENGEILSVGLNGGVLRASVDTYSTPLPNPIIDNHTLNFQVGANSGDAFSVDLTDARTKALSIDDIDLSTRQGAESAIFKIDKAMEKVSSERGKYGAYQNALEHIHNNVSNYELNLTASESRIRDTDIAKQMMILTKNQILSQASQSMLSHVNQQPQQVLQLLR